MHVLTFSSMLSATLLTRAMTLRRACPFFRGLTHAFGAGPWLLKAGWGPLARLEFATDAGIARCDRPAGLIGLVRHSRAAFAAAHHPGYANFLRKRLEEESVEGESNGDEDDDALHANEWNRGQQDEPPPDGRETELWSSTKTTKLKNAGATGGLILNLPGGDGGETGDEELLMERAVAEVGRLEDLLGRRRKSRMGNVKDRPPLLGQPLIAQLYGSRRKGDALLDIGRGKIVRRTPRRAPKVRNRRSDA